MFGREGVRHARGSSGREANHLPVFLRPGGEGANASVCKEASQTVKQGGGQAGG